MNFLGMLESIDVVVRTVLGSNAVWSVYVDGPPECRNLHVRMANDKARGRCMFTDTEVITAVTPEVILSRVRHTAEKVKRAGPLKRSRPNSTTS